jgi:transcriptional regulator with XRE-family HTH domain
MEKKDELLIRMGEVIRARRKARGVSQEQLAHASGLHATYIGSLERGEVNISVLKLEKVAKSLDCQLCDLLPGGRNRDANKMLAELITFLEAKDEKFLKMSSALLHALEDSAK